MRPRRFSPPQRRSFGSRHPDGENGVATLIIGKNGGKGRPGKPGILALRDQEPGAPAREKPLPAAPDGRKNLPHAALVTPGVFLRKAYHPPIWGPGPWRRPPWNLREKMYFFPRAIRPQVSWGCETCEIRDISPPGPEKSGFHLPCAASRWRRFPRS